MIITSTVPSFLSRKPGDLINRYDGPRVISQVLDRKPANVSIGGKPAYTETYVTRLSDGA